MLGEDRSTSTAEALARWFQSFPGTSIPLPLPSLVTLLSLSERSHRQRSTPLSDFELQFTRHLAAHHSSLPAGRTRQVSDRSTRLFRLIPLIRKVKETLRIAQLKDRHPDRWQQHQNAQIQQGQMEQRIQLRLREIYSARSEQSSNIANELTRVQTMINDECQLTSSLDKQLQIYRQLLTDLNQLAQVKEQLNLLIGNANNKQGSWRRRSNGCEQSECIAGMPMDLLNPKATLTEKNLSTVQLSDLCATMNAAIQQRINQLRFERPSSTN